MVTDLRPLEVEDDRPYHYFVYVSGKPEHATGFDRGIKWEVCGYSVDGDRLKLPYRARQYYKSEEAAAVATGLLNLFAVGKNKREIEEMKGPEI